MDFIRNAWYVAAWSSELCREKPLARTLLDEPVVLLRDMHGNACALVDRCPHRFAPLSRGTLHDGVLECPYHGLRFDGTGLCTHNPHGDGQIPDRASVRSFPVRERQGIVWIWMGDPACAASCSPPSFDFLDPDTNVVSTGYMLTQANYQLSADNLLDLSHFQYLHPDTLGSGSLAAGTLECGARGDSVWSRRCTRGEQLPPFVASAFSVPPDTPVDRRLEVHWDAPGLMTIDVGVRSPAEPAERVSRSAHCLTPHSATSTHYFFAFGLPKLLGDAAATLVAYAVAGLITPFRDEDLPMLAAQQAALDRASAATREPLMLPIDEAAQRARRIVARRLAEERS
jgi:phenylpropionate dioxygenase-like ring-hydroxylating dioxygenase large terminal subunit